MKTVRDPDQVLTQGLAAIRSELHVLASFAGEQGATWIALSPAIRRWKAC